MQVITIKDNEKFLRQISKPININNLDSLEKNIKILETYCKENEVLAMAAVQLGILKRLIYLKNTNIDIINKIQNNETKAKYLDYNEARILINPIIVKKEGLTEYWEACASCLDNVGKVKRPYRIFLEYLDVSGKKHKDIFEGFESTVLSHEMDHLDGILHMDIAEKVVILPKEERKKLRQKEDYKIFSTDGNYEDLKKINIKKLIKK